MFDGFIFSDWSYWDSRNVAGDQVAHCSEKAVNITGQNCSGKVPVGITFQNNQFLRNGGFGVLWANNAGGLRYFHNTFRDNITRGYTTQINHWQAKDQPRNRVTFMWGNRIINGADNSPVWSIPGKICDGNATLKCLDGPNAGANCTGEGLTKECGYGHCGGMCAYDEWYNGNPRNEGYSCECSETAQCASGLSCVDSLGNQLGGNTEGRGIIIDRSGNGSALDIRNNIIAMNQGDCISVFRSDMGSSAKGKGFIANNTCWHNAEKGSSYAEINVVGRYLNVANNIIAPGTQGFCKSGSSGGQVCTNPGQNGGSCGSNGIGCEIPTYFFYDNADAFSDYAPDRNVYGGTTMWSNKNLFFVPAFLSNPISFEYAAPGSGETRLQNLTQFRAYGTGRDLKRDQNSLAADPKFVSVDPASPDFLRIAAGSPAVGAGDPTMAPPFDIDGATRPNPPSIGAFEVAGGGGGGPTTTTVRTTTSTTAAGGGGTTTTVPDVGPFVSLWPASATPAVSDGLADVPVELGVRFTSDVAGSITAVRFYKDALNTGPHTGSVWREGTRLATAPFVDETASGWQSVTLPAPVPLEAGVEYVVSYHATVGHYAEDNGYFAQPYTRGPFTAPVSAGVFDYAGGFPTQAYQSTNYWVDFTFSPNGVTTTTSGGASTTTVVTTTTTTASGPGGTTSTLVILLPAGPSYRITSEGG